MKSLDEIKQILRDSFENFGLWVMNLSWGQALAFIAPGIILAILSYIPGAKIEYIAEAVLFIGALPALYKLWIQGFSK